MACIFVLVLIAFASSFRHNWSLNTKFKGNALALQCISVMYEKWRHFCSSVVLFLIFTAGLTGDIKAWKCFTLKKYLGNWGIIPYVSEAVIKARQKRLSILSFMSQSGKKLAYLHLKLWDSRLLIIASCSIRSKFRTTTLWCALRYGYCILNMSII